MPTNKVIYFGLLVIAASALLWVGVWLARKIDDWVLITTGIVGVVMVIVGMALEVKKKKAAALAVPSDEGQGG